MKIAVFTPLNPAKCGISDYSEALLPHMAAHAEITVFHDEYDPEPVRPLAGIALCNRREFDPAAFDVTLYQIGNNPYHIYAYDEALRHPGVVTLHEYNLHHLVADATIKRDDWDAYLAEAEHNGGAEALAFARRVRSLEVGPDYEGVAMNRRLIESSRALVVHSDYLLREVRAAGHDLTVARIPHGADVVEVNHNSHRAVLGLDPESVLIGIFGFLKPYKRIKESLKAMQRLVRLDPRVRMILVGEEHPDFDVRRMVRELGLTEHVGLKGYVDLAEFDQLMGSVDICLNLRYPTAGETSGTLLRALATGRATVVSDVGAFGDLPDDVCLKVPPGAGEVDLLTEYLNLLVARPAVRNSLGERARQFVATECAWERVGEQYVRFLEDVARGEAKSDEPAVIAMSTQTEPKEPREFRPRRKRAEDVDDFDDWFDEAKPAPPAYEENEELASYIRGYCHDRPGDASYVEKHLTRLVRTIEITPPGTDEQRCLEMGAYMHITPALKNKLGYGEVRGSYLGAAGRVDKRTVSHENGETFHAYVDCFNAEKDAYPYDDDSFDTVICCELLEHLYDDPMHMMGEVNRILRPGGHFVVSTPNICSLRAVQAALLGYHPGLFHQYIRPDENGELDPRHAREYAPRDMKVLLEAAGMEVAHMETGPYLFRQTVEYVWVERLLTRYGLPEHLRGDSIFAVGRKVGPLADRYPPALYVGGAD